MDAVAPVKIRVGGCLGLCSLAIRRRGRTAWEKWKAPALGWEGWVSVRVGRRLDVVMCSAGELPSCSNEGIATDPQSWVSGVSALTR